MISFLGFAGTTYVHEKCTSVFHYQTSNIIKRDLNKITHIVISNEMNPLLQEIFEIKIVIKMSSRWQYSNSKDSDLLVKSIEDGRLRTLAGLA